MDKFATIWSITALTLIAINVNPNLVGGFVIERMQMSDSNECTRIEEREVMRPENLTYICPRPDKCDNWWNNIFDGDCQGPDKLCVKTVYKSVKQNLTISECCQGWARDEAGECSISLCSLDCGVNGECEVRGGQAVCQCYPGWSGERCLIPVSSTTTQPGYSTTSIIIGPPADHCLHGGTPETDGRRVICVCAPGWIGSHCQYAISTASASAPSVPVTTELPASSTRIPPVFGGSKGEGGDRRAWIWPVGVLACLAGVAVVVAVVLHRRRSCKPCGGKAGKPAGMKVPSSETVELEIVSSLGGTHRISRGEDTLYEPVGQGTGTLRGSLPRLEPPTAQSSPKPAENIYHEPDQSVPRPCPPPPAYPVPQGPGSLAIPDIPRSLFTGSIHVYEDPTNLQRSPKYAPDMTYSEVTDSQRSHGHYDLANTVSSVYSSSLGSEGNRETFMSDHYDVPRNLDDIQENDDVTGGDDYDTPRISRMDLSPTGSDHVTYDLAGRLRGGSLGDITETSQLRHSEDSLDNVIPVSEEGDTSNSGKVDHVYNEVDSDRSHEYVNVNDVSETSSLPETPSVDGYCNRQPPRKDSKVSISFDLNNDYSYATQTSVSDAPGDTPGRSRLSSAHPYADIDGDEKINNPKVLDRGYSEVTCPSPSLAPHKLVLVTSDDDDYIGPDRENKENLYQSYDDEKAVYSNEDLSAVTSDTSYEDLSGRSQTLTRSKSKDSVSSDAPRVSVLPASVQKWSMRDSSLYVAPDVAAVRSTPEDEQVYGNVTPDCELYVNQSFDETEEEALSDSDEGKVQILAPMNGHSESELKETVA